METRSKRRRRTTETTIPEPIPEAILVEILTILPLRTIARFKSVSKPWKSMIESAYFRRRFLCLHKNSPSSWSLMFKEYPLRASEGIGFHGCKTWDLPKSLGSYFVSFQLSSNLPTLDYFYRDSSNGLVLVEVSNDHSTENKGHEFKIFVGNPILQEWVEIPPPPNRCYATGLISRLEDGLVSSFKVVMTEDIDRDKDIWDVCVYSSESGAWSFKRLLCKRPVSHLIDSYYPPENLNGKYYLWERDSSPTDHGILLAHDFYDPEEADDQCRVIPLPLPNTERGKRCLTTSGGDVVYIQFLSGRLKVWRLNDNNSESSELWQLSWEINLVSVAFDFDCFPMAMNPFDSDIVYLWSEQHSCFVTANLKTQKFVFHWILYSQSSNEGCYLYNTNDSKRYICGNGMNGHSRVMYHPSRVLMLSQFVLPKWMDSVPRLPN